MRLQRLFQPFEINQMTVKNRLAMTAMHLLYTEDGSVNQRTKDFYLARAKGGVGMIIAGGTAADPYIGYSHMLRMPSTPMTASSASSSSPPAATAGRNL